MKYKIILLLLIVLGMLINPVFGLGIKIDVGTPEIRSVSCSDGMCNVEVKNIGNSPGAFCASFIGAPGTDFSMKYITSNFMVMSNEIVTTKVHVYADSNEGNSIGIIKVIDINDASRYDTQEVYMYMSPPKICVPDAIRQSGNNIYQCNEKGTKEELILNCANGHLRNDGRIENGGWYCQNIESEIPFLNPFTIFGIILVVVILLNRQKSDIK